MTTAVLVWGVMQSVELMGCRRHFTHESCWVAGGVFGLVILHHRIAKFGYLDVTHHLLQAIGLSL